MSDRLYRLVYSSDIIAWADIDRIVADAWTRNAELGVTGALLVESGQVVQALEGPQIAVEELFAAIERDARHTVRDILQRKTVERPSFADRPMALAGRTPSGRALWTRLIGQGAGDDGVLDIDWLVESLRRTLEQDRLGETANAEAETVSAPAERPRAPPTPFEDRLRTELAELSPGHDRRSERRSPDGAADRTARTSVAAPAEICAKPSARGLADGFFREQVSALSRSQALLHVDLSGAITHANDEMLSLLGYAAEEIVGRPHAMLMDPADVAGGHAAFREALNAGAPQAGRFRRRAKDGRTVWLQGVHAPVTDAEGRAFAVVCMASDVSDEVRTRSDEQWQVAAIHKSHAVISFDMHGLILDANHAFLEACGYDLGEIVGRHHRMFVEPSYAHGAEYAAFWRALGQGRHQAGEYKRVGKGGREFWLQATYNPVFDADGAPVRVIKYATLITEERLRQAEHQGQIAAIHKAQGVVSFDLDGVVIDANDNFLDAMGYRLADVRGRHHRMFVDPAYADSADYAAFWARLGEGRHHSGEYRRIGRDGSEVWLRATYNPILDMNGRPFRVMKYATDVTAEKLAQADFEGQIAAIRKSQGVIAFGLDGTILDMNENFLAMLGYTLDEVKGRPHSMLVEPDYGASRDYAAFWETLRAGEFLSGMYKRVGKDGRTIWIQASYNPILDLGGRPIKIVKYATDVTSNVALAEAFEDAQRQAQHDPATSLPNRTRLASFMTAALAHPSAQLAVLYLDLDRFKPVNDTFGHAVGDKVLGEFADRLRRILATDHLAARVGGDEFVIAAPGLCEEEIEALCQRVLDGAAGPFMHDGSRINVGVSIGVAVSPTDGTSADELLRCADVALYRSKQEGGGTFSFYADAMNDKIVAYRGLVAEMRRGLAEEEFFLEFQPRYETASKTIKSVEALVRWAHPEQGRVGPAEFIPLAEKSGLIVPLGEWVLMRACEAAASWRTIGVSVNVSPAQFRDQGFVDKVAATLTATGIEASRLELEITEGVLLENAERALHTLEALKRLGVRLAMDDFGTGYSSLSALRTYPFDVIKIDRQFVADIDKRSGGRDVVRAILGLGRALNLSVTAEGVETADQAAMLAEDECDELQGFLLAKPLPAEGVDELLGRRRRSVA